MKLSHDDLVKIAAQWLIKKRYPIVITEIACAVGEEPDAIGFKDGSSTLIECKANRPDFKRDSKKTYRRNECKTALGSYRYYCAPKNLIKLEELPKKWGLLEVDPESLNVRCVFKPVVFQNKCYRSEVYMLMSLVRRIGQTSPNGVSIDCYIKETKNRAKVYLDKD